MFRKRREHDCSCCRNFIKNIGRTIWIDESLNLHTIFEFNTHSETFQPVMDALDAYVKSCAITDIYFNDSPTVGTDKNHELLGDGDVITWDHFWLRVPASLVMKRSEIATMKGSIRDRRNVFKRSLDDISMEALDIVLELISSNTLCMKDTSSLVHHVETEAKINIVKYIFRDKELEAEDRQQAAINAAKKKHIMDILAQKQDESLRNMSKEELESMLADLG